MSPRKPDCTVSGCTDPQRGSGPYCNKHRQRARKYGGDPLGTAPERESTLRQRLEVRVQRGGPDDCWPYDGANQSGYGVIAEGKKARKAHRVAYELWVGPIPDGQTLDHECHNRAYAARLCPGGDDCPHRRCCNPAHLIPRTGWENTGRGGAITAENARKDRCPEGHEYEILRICRTCMTDASARHRHKNREIAAVLAQG